ARVRYAVALLEVPLPTPFSQVPPAEPSMIALLLTGAVVLLTVSMLLAPVETLGWWAGWFGEGLDQPGDDDVADYQIVRGDKQPRLYIVYLDGIAKAAHRNYEDVQGLLDGLDARLPDAVILGDFMPYSV